jgi:hypothetical protein
MFHNRMVSLQLHLILLVHKQKIPNRNSSASEPNLLKMRYKHRGAVERRNCSPLVARRRGGVPHHHLSVGSGPVLPGHHHLPPPPPLHHHQAPPPAHSSSVVMAAKRMSQLTSNQTNLTNTHLVIEYLTILTFSILVQTFVLFYYHFFFNRLKN